MKNLFSDVRAKVGGVRSSSRLRLLWFVALFAIIGAVVVLVTRAGSPVAYTEAESGSLAGGASKQSDSNASGSNYLQFGSGQSAPSGDLAGVFISKADLQRAKSRIANSTAPFMTVYGVQKSKADGALGSTPDPFRPADYNGLKYNWCESLNERQGTIDGNVDNSLGDATRKLLAQGNTTRALALQYALTGDRRYGDKALQYLKAWSEQSRVVNTHDFEVSASNFWTAKNQTSGMCTSARPLNFMLDVLFQGEGLIGFSDAYSLLALNGYNLSSTDNTTIRGYLRRLAEGVNSSFQVWIRYGETQDPSNMRYKADNHLSWSLAYLISAAAALDDQQLANYCINGGVWNDSRLPTYNNKTSLKWMINLGILSDGRMIDPVQFGRPETYTFFHLFAMNVSSRVAELHFDQDMWNYKGSDGAGLEKAYASAAPKISSYLGHTFQFEQAYNKWPTALNKSTRDRDRSLYISQAFGPVSLLLGQ